MKSSASTSADGAGWPASLRGLVACGASGVALVTNDAHPSLADAVAAMLPGAGWRTCRTHVVSSLLCRVPRSVQLFVASLVALIFAQPDAEPVREQHARCVTERGVRFPSAAALLEEAGDETLALSAFPNEVWRQVWGNKPLERRNREIRRRSDVVGIFPDRATVVRVIGAVLAERNVECADADRRSYSLEAIGKTLAPGSPEAVAEVPLIAASASRDHDVPAVIFVHHFTGRVPFQRSGRRADFRLAPACYANRGVASGGRPDVYEVFVGLGSPWCSASAAG